MQSSSPPKLQPRRKRRLSRQRKRLKTSDDVLTDGKSFLVSSRHFVSSRWTLPLLHRHFLTSLKILVSISIVNIAHTIHRLTFSLPTDQISQLNWIISAFNLTSAAFLFFWAQLTDLFGRHNTLQAAILIMIIGSAICTGAPTSTFSVLLLGRALQGVGAAGVNISIRTILADRVSLSEYALNWTIFALVSGVGFSVGPVIGGYLNTASWRWCFAINLPIGVVAMIAVILVLRKDLQGPQPLPQLEGHDMSTAPRRFVARLLTIDYGGQMLFLWGFGLLILALTWAGGNYAWDSPAVLAPIIIGGVLAIAWVVYERCMVPGSVMARALPKQKAMVPWELLSQRDIGLLFLVNFSIGVSMFAVMYFMDLYFALVEQRSSSNAGISLLFFLPGLGGEYHPVSWLPKGNLY